MDVPPIVRYPFAVPKLAFAFQHLERDDAFLTLIRTSECRLNLLICETHEQLTRRNGFADPLSGNRKQNIAFTDINSRGIER